MLSLVIVMLFSYTSAMADSCGGTLGECWFFNNLKHTIQFDGATTQGNVTTFQYTVTKDGNINVSHFYFGIPTCKGDCMNVTTQPTSDSFNRCEGDPQSNVGIGDCEHCWIRFNENLSKNVPATWYIEVTGQVNINTIPIQIHSGNEYEVGTIFGPACITADLIERTQVEVTAADGSRLKITTDREGNCLEVLKLPPGGDPNNPGDWVDIGCSGIALEDTHFCIPPTVDHPANSVIEGNIDAHCGSLEHMTSDTDGQITNALRFKIVGGKVIYY